MREALPQQWHRPQGARKMAMKYESDTCKLSNCPPLRAVPRTTRAYRYVWIGQQFGDSFLPTGKMHGRRVLPGEPNQQTAPVATLTCCDFSLSFYTTEVLAVAAFERMAARRPIHKTLGTHLAVVDLDLADGLQEPPSKNGHFELHEFESAVFDSRAVLVRQLHVEERGK